jgi:hypothetical protein
VVFRKRGFVPRTLLRAGSYRGLSTTIRGGDPERSNFVQGRREIVAGMLASSDVADDARTG